MTKQDFGTSISVGLMTSTFALLGHVHAWLLRRVPFFETLWTVAHQSPLSVKFFRQNTGVSFSPPGDLPNPEIEPASPVFPTLQVDS